MARSVWARAIVLLVSGFWTASYDAYCHRQRGRERLAALLAITTGKALLPIALRLNHKAAVDQMVEECWWG